MVTFTKIAKTDLISSKPGHQQQCLIAGWLIRIQNNLAEMDTGLASVERGDVASFTHVPLCLVSYDFKHLLIRNQWSEFKIIDKNGC